MLEAARSQIAGTVSQTEVTNLPMNGRNFLDLALLVPGVSPTNIGSTQLFAETSAVPGVGPLGRQPAQLLEQLHRRRPVGQRRCGRAERDAVRRRRRRSVPGGHVGRAGGARARARRLRQRRDQERHERARTATSTATSATTASTRPNALSGTTLPMTPAAVRRQPRRPARRDRTFFFANVEQRRLDQTGLVDDLPTPNVAIINARLAAVGYPGAPVATGVYPNPVHSDERPRRRSITSSAAAISSAFATASTTSTSSNSRGAGGAERAERVGRAGQHRSDDRVQQHADALGADGERDARAVRVQRPAGAADRSDRTRPSASPASRRSARSSGSPTGASEQDVPGRRQPVASGGRARAARRRRLPLQRRHDHLSRGRSRGAYTFSSLANFLDRHLQQRRLHADVRRRPWCRRRIRTSASTRRTSGRSARA